MLVLLHLNACHDNSYSSKSAVYVDEQGAGEKNTNKQDMSKKDHNAYDLDEQQRQNHPDLIGFIAEVKQQPFALNTVEPVIFAPDKFKTSTLDPASLTVNDPFQSSMVKLQPAQSLCVDSQVTTNRPLLSEFIFSQLLLRGVLTKKQQKIALFESPDKKIHSVKVGDVISENLIKIIDIHWQYITYQKRIKATPVYNKKTHNIKNIDLKSCYIITEEKMYITIMEKF